jgi:hypothetical protein
MRLLLIDSRVKNYEAFVNACIPNEVEAIVFNFLSDNYASILSKKTQESYESVALVSHNYKRPVFQLTLRERPCYIRDKNTFASWDGFYSFLSGFNTPIVDLMACSLFSDQKWKSVFVNLESRGAINFRASADDTGNLSAGGNWVLESDNVNVKDLYFTELIGEYKYLLTGQFQDLFAWKKSNNLNTDFTPGDVYVWGNPALGGSPDGTTGTGDIEKISTISNVKRIYSTGYAFAALTSSGDVWVWGDPNAGGSPVYGVGNGAVTQIPGLTGVTAIYSTRYAFAALTGNSGVFVWGDPDNGGAYNGSAGPIEGLTGVTAIYSASYAFAALTGNSGVFVWGDPDYGGAYNGSAGPIEGLTGVTAIYSTFAAFAALTGNSGVFVWGDPDNGGAYNGSAGPIEGLTGVTAIYSTGFAFAAIVDTTEVNGGVFVWGSSFGGGDYGGVSGPIEGLTGVTAIYSTFYAFAALKGDGGVFVWGAPFAGGDYGGSAGPIDGLTGVTAIYSTFSAFAALTSGTVWVWGDPNAGGSPEFGVNSQGPIEGLGDVTTIYSTDFAFAALTGNDTVWVWGDPNAGGSPTPTGSGNLDQIISPGFFGITSIYSNGGEDPETSALIGSFAAKNSNGEVFVWGASNAGGSPTPTNPSGNVAKVEKDGFTNPSAIYASIGAFAAIVPKPTPPTPSYNIVIPIKNNAFSNLLNYLLFFPDN